MALGPGAVNFRGAGLEARQVPAWTARAGLFFPQGLPLRLQRFDALAASQGQLGPLADGRSNHLLLKSEALVGGWSGASCWPSLARRPSHPGAGRRPVLVALTQPGSACLWAQSALQFLAAGEQFLLQRLVQDAQLAILNCSRAWSGVARCGNRTGRHREFVDQAATITGPHRDDAGYIPLPSTTLLPSGSTGRRAAQPEPCTCCRLQSTPRRCSCCCRLPRGARPRPPG